MQADIEGVDVESRSSDQGSTHREVLESTMLTALLPPIPEWPDLN